MKRTSWNDPLLLFDQNEVQYIAQKMLQGSYISIIGPPLMGKSLLMKQVEQFIKQTSKFLYCCYFDIYEMLEMPRERFFGEILDKIHNVVGIHDIYATEYTDPVRTLIDYCSNITNRLFIFIPNIDYLDDRLAKELLLSFRAISQDITRRQNVVLAVSGSLNLLHWTIGISSPFNIAEKYIMKPLALQEVANYISRVEHERGLLFKTSTESIGDLYKITNGNPYLIHKLANRLITPSSEMNIELIDNILQLSDADQSALDIYFYRIKKALEENENNFFFLLNYLNHIEEPFHVNKESLQFSGMFSDTGARGIRFSNQIVANYVRNHYDLVRLGHISIKFGRWDIAEKLFSKLDRNKRIVITTSKITEDLNAYIDVLRAYGTLLVGEQNVDCIQNMFMKGMELFVNVKKFIIYKKDLAGSRLIPELYYGFESPPDCINIDPTNDALACCTNYRKHLIMTTDCNYFAAPIEKNNKEILRIFYASMDFSQDVIRPSRKKIIEEISNLAYLMNLVYFNAVSARDVRSLLATSMSIDENQLSQKHELLRHIIAYLQQKASLEKKIYFILSAFTIKNSLEFNRAFIFRTDVEKRYLVGYMGIGSMSAEEYGTISNDDFFNNPEGVTRYLWNNYEMNKRLYADSQLSMEIRSLKFDMTESDNILIYTMQNNKMTVLDSNSRGYDSFVRALDGKNILADRMLIFPLVVEDERIGVICVDNKWSRKEFNLIDILLANILSAQTAFLIREERFIQKEYEIENQRKQFINNASHELRTPVHTLTGLVENIRKLGFKKEDLDILDFYTARLSFAVNNIMDFANIEKGDSICANLQTMRIDDLYDRIEMLFNSLRISDDSKFMKKHMLIVNKQYHYHECIVSFDCVMTILRNLFQNARQASRDNSKIVLTVSQNKEYMEFIVEDYGEGIPQAYINDFLDFDEDIPPTNTSGKHLGLGLKICKNMIAMMNGKFALANKIDKTGLIVRVSLPNFISYQ
jgi:signal transduction histidine kinase